MSLTKYSFFELEINHWTYKIYFEDTEKSWIIAQNFREDPNNTFASFKVENSNEDLPIGVKEWIIKSSDQTKRVNLEFTKVVFSS